MDNTEITIRDSIPFETALGILSVPSEYRLLITLPIHQLRQTIQRHTSNLYDTLFTRRLSIYFTKILARLNMHPDVISAVALLCGLASGVMIALAATPWVYVGVVLLHLHQILDSVDGELARLYKRPSMRGMFLEDLSAYLLINIYFIAFATYLFRRDGDAFALGAAIVVVACGRNAMPVVRRVILLTLHARAASPVVPTENNALPKGDQKASGPSNFLTRIRHLVEEHLLHYTNVRVVLSTALIVEQVSIPARIGVLRWLFFAYLALQMLKELGTVALHLRRGAIEQEISLLHAKRDSTQTKTKT